MKDTNQTASPIDVPAASRRFTFVDGLRGIAALSVTLFHLGPAGVLAERLHDFVPKPIFALSRYGFLGVPIFFVLSGFVIAYSQRGVFVTPRFLGRFALRRSLRLDPPYWATIALVLILNAILNPMRPGREIPFPGWKDLLAHLFYMQGLLQQRVICVVFWTLTFEVQFYLVLTIVTGIAQRLPLHDQPLAGVRHGSRLFVFVPLAVLSLMVSLGWLRNPPGLFLSLWYSFFLGVMAWAVIERSVSVKWFWAYLLLISATLIAPPHSTFDTAARAWRITAMATAIAIYSAASLHRMDRWLSAGWIQFLGTISYSLYLVHFPVGETINSLGARVCKGSNLLVLAWVMMSTFACIGAAYIMYRLVERPAFRWAHRFRYDAPRT